VPYVTQQQLIERFSQDKLIQLTDRADDGALDVSVLNEAIADAGKVIDAYVAPRYLLPLAQARIDASPLTRMAGDLVIYFLQGDLATEESERRYKEALQFLKDVQGGRASLGADDAVAAPAGTVEYRGGESMHDWGTY
jgi:phage gp36-like protein